RLPTASARRFRLLCPWMLGRGTPTRRQLAGMRGSFVGILRIASHGAPGKLLQLELHAGDAWIVLARPVWGLYSVLLKRRPPDLNGVSLLFVISVAGLALLAPAFAPDALHPPPRWPGARAAAGCLCIC